MTPERLAEIESLVNSPDDSYIWYYEDYIRELLAGYRELVACVQQVGPWPQVYDTYFCNYCGNDLTIGHEAECVGVTIAALLNRAHHDPTQPEDDEQHEPVEQAVVPPGIR
jgi:hypothetical protein